MREIALDTETTGLDPYAGHRIVEIGAVEMIGHIRTANHFHVYLNPQRDMPKEAERVHGISEEFLRDKPLFHSVAAAFREFMGDSPLVIHNANFDMKFINFEFEKVGFPKIPMSQTIDTVTMARKMFPGSPANLDALCKRFNIDLSKRVKHGALLDAELLADVYLELKGGRQAGLGLLNDQGTSGAQQSSDGAASPLVAGSKEIIPPRSFTPTEDELRAHKQLLDTMKGDPLWNSYG